VSESLSIGIVLRRVLTWPLYAGALALFLVLFLGLRLVWVVYWAVAGPVALVLLVLATITRVGALMDVHDWLISLIDFERLDALAASPVDWAQRLRGVEDW
jgi:hypothetical protein